MAYDEGLVERPRTLFSQESAVDGGDEHRDDVMALKDKKATL